MCVMYRNVMLETRHTLQLQVMSANLHQELLFPRNATLGRNISTLTIHQSIHLTVNTLNLVSNSTNNVPV